jgi:micrococcal nuclease
LREGDGGSVLRRLTVVVVALAAAGCGGAAPSADRDCADFRDQAAAQKALDAQPGDPEGLDADGNGVACESLGAAAVGAPSEGRARVISVVDGDTIKVRLAGGARATVRLVGIDTPESRRPGTPIECGSKRAAQTLRRLVAGRDVALVRDRTQDARDRYGRMLAYVDVGSRDAGEEMVRSGWAKPYVYGGVPFARLRAYRAAESAARRARAGVYGACGGRFHNAA